MKAESLTHGRNHGFSLVEMMVALVAHVAGMLALRWLFFAEAEHVQALYYGKK